MAAPLTLWPPVAQRLPLAWLWCGLLLAGGLVGLHPRVFLGLGGAILRRLGRPPLTLQFRAGNYAAPLALMLLNACLGGLALWLLARAITDVPAGWIPLFIAASSLAGVTGFLAFFAPGGLGVREGVPPAILGVAMSPAEAALAAAGVAFMLDAG